jgi:hypothetical protein
MFFFWLPIVFPTLNFTEVIFTAFEGKLENDRVQLFVNA